MEVTFQAQIRQLQSFISASGDKGGKLVLMFNVLDDALIGDLAKMVKTDEEIEVTVKG